MPTLILQVSASADDLSVYWDGSVWSITATTLTWGYIYAGYYSAGILKMGNGLRFLNATIPKGATITTAYLILTCRLAGSQVTVNTRIVGDDEDNAATFSTLADYQARRGTDVGGADNTKRTTADVAWDNIGAWTVNTEYQSPEIKTIIQEIVNRAGWVSGNALALFWDDHENRSTQAGVRGRYGWSFDSSAAKCAKLHIEYTHWSRNKSASMTAKMVGGGIL